jgi:hypothetical protein
MKALITLILGSLSLAAGGVVMLYLNGNNIFNPDVWSFAVQVFLTAPGFMISEAVSGQSKDLVRGILISLGGLSLAAVFGSVAVLLSVIRSAKHPRKVQNDNAKSSKEQKPLKLGGKKEKAPIQSGKVKREGPGAFAKLKSWIKSLKKKTASQPVVFKDAVAGLEDDDKPAKESLFSKLKSRLDAGKNKKKTMVIKSGSEEEAVIEISDDKEFLSDLKEWYASLKHVAQDDKGTIQEAKDLVARASRRVRTKVTDDDAMNGEFMLRMMDAWANKKQVSKTVDDIPIVMSNMDDDSLKGDTFSRAIQEVMEEGVAPENEDDEFALEDEVDDEGDDFIIQDLEDVEAGLEDEIEEDNLDDDFGISDEEDDSESEHSDDGIDLPEAENGSDDFKAILAARYILDFRQKAVDVENFEDAWEDELSETSARRAYVEEMFEALTQALEEEAEKIMEFSTFDAEEDVREIEWLQENLGQIEECKEETLAAAGELIEDEEDPDDDADLETEFGIGGVSDDAEAGDDTSTDFDDEISQVEDLGDDGADVSEDQDIPDDTEQEDDVSNASELPDAGDENHSLEDETSADEPEAIEKNEAVVETHEPRDVSLPELDEIEKSDELIYNWALVAKSAGAAEAKISHSVIAKDGLRRRIVGITHLVSAWRGEDKDDSRRLNILLRYLPEGEWTLEMEDYKQNGIKMVDSRGDYVQVSAEMISQPEIENGILLVHFYGPGATGEVLEEEGNLIVTNATLSVDKVRDKMAG